MSQRSSTADLQQLAGLKLAAGDVRGAIALYHECLTFERDNPGIYNNLGVALIKARRFDEAIDALNSALKLQPGYQRPLVNLGKALRENGRLADAMVVLREALAIQSDYVPALVNLGDALAASGDFEAAQRTLERAVLLAPGHVEAHMSLGIARLHGGHLAAALESLHHAVALGPEHAEAHTNLAHALFCSGDWASSWPHFEYRLRRLADRAPAAAPAHVTRWDGIGNPEGEIWLIGEQGLGDQLQFARYAKLLEVSGFRCVLACDARLVKLLAYSLPEVRVVAFGAQPANPGTTAWMPLMSMAMRHRTAPDTVPYPKRYLAADSVRLDQWRARLTAIRGPRVGLAWAGNPQMETGRYVGRSPPLAAFAPLFKKPAAHFISLQKGHGVEQLGGVPFGDSILRLPDLDSGPDAFLDTAAVLECVDLLITSDTAIAHLAGGLGVPTWLCLMHDPDWRWMLQGTVSPWYDSMRLFRQPAPGDWASVYAEIAARLAAGKNTSAGNRTRHPEDEVNPAT
jgi:Flp pilus assembly protein TadD